MKKRVLAILLVFMFVFTLVACKDTEKPVDGDSGDKVAPMLTIEPAEVSIEYGQEYDLMTGVTARDNLDGIITDKVVVDRGTFDNKVEGTYEINYSVKDKAGNESKGKRTITVQELRATVEIDGEQFPFNLNPQLNPNNNHIGSFPFDLTRVNIFEQEYADWLFENADQRFAAYWSAVAITDKDLKVVELRDFNTNEFKLDAQGSPVVGVATTWSTGTTTSDGKNAAYENHRGMLANLEIPKGGYVFVFINDGVNGANSPRTFGSLLVDMSLEVLGFQIKIHNASEEDKYVAANSNPIIKLTEYEMTTGRQIESLKFDKGFSVEEELGKDLLKGVTVYHDSETIKPTVKEISFKDKADKEFTTVAKAEDIDTTVEDRTYFITYEAKTSKGKIDTETRAVYIKKAEKPVDPVGKEKVVKIGDLMYEYTLNYKWDHGSGIGAGSGKLVNVFEKAHLSGLVGFNEPKDDGNWPAGVSYTVGWSFSVVIDKDGKVIEFRVGTARYGWDTETAKIVNKGTIKDNAQQVGVLDVIPEGGYYIVFQNSELSVAQEVRRFGTKAFTGYEDVTNFTAGGIAGMTVNPFVEGFKVELTEATKVEKAVVQIGNFHHLVTKNYKWDNTSGIGVDVKTANVFEASYLKTLVGFNEPKENGNWPEGISYTVGWSFSVITDKDGKVIEFRAGTARYGWDTETEKIVNKGTIKDDAQQVGVLDVIPEDGYYFVFQNSVAPGQSIREFGVKAITGYDTLALFTAGGVTGMTVNPFTEKFTVYTRLKNFYS